MFIYEDGLPVAYDHTVHEFGCRNGCINPDVHDAVDRRMLQWLKNHSGQTRVRVGKIGLMQGSEVNLKRMEHE